MPPSIRQFGVIAVIMREDRFLTIRRSQKVSAPGAFCFPGGGIEPGETEQQALVRELQEELDIAAAAPLRRLWTSVTPRRVHLAWWAAQIDTDVVPRPNPAEVSECFWWTADEMDQCEALLVSNREFLAWWREFGD